MPGRIMVAVVDPMGKIVQFNRQVELATGYKLDEIAGRVMWDLLLEPRHAADMREGVRGAAAGEDVADAEGDWLARDGSRFPARWGYSLLRDSVGLAQYVVITGADLRAGGRVQAELADSLNRYQVILDTAVDAILTIDEDGAIQSFNRSAERIFGYRAVEVVGRNVSLLMPPPYRAEHDGYLQNYLSTRRKKIIGLGREVEGLRKDGTVFPLELSVGEVLSNGQRIFTGIIRDISDRKQVELEARRRQDELAHLTRVHSMGDLAAGLAHEINQPLTAILGHSRACVRMIEAGTADMGLLHDSMVQIAKQGERAAEVVRRLRRYVEKGEIERQPSDLADSVREVLELLQHELRRHQVRVSVDGFSDLPSMLIDRVQVEQVLVNLVRNAVEAMAGDNTPAPVLVLSAACSEAPQGVCVTLRDNGPGFGGAAPEHLFEPFFTTKSTGLGQGLSICRRIIEAHGGRIWAEPIASGGASFSLWLPLPSRDGKSANAGEG